MRVVSFTSIFYLFFISGFLAFGMLQAYPEFRPDRDNKRHHKLGWAYNRRNVNGSGISPELIAVYIYLEHPAISNDEYADLRKMLLYSLNTNEFLKIYNESQVVRDWPESQDLIERIFQANDYNKVKTLITGFDTEHFIKWYPCVAYHYESSKRMHECYRKLLSHEFDKNSYDGRLLVKHADNIKNAVANGPKFSHLTLADTGIYSSFKNSIGCGTDRRSKISWSAKSYIEDNFSREDHNKVLAEFNTVEQQALQGKIIDNFNRIAKLAHNAPIKKQEFLKEAGNFSIIANEYNHSGWIELGNKAVIVVEKLLDFAVGVGEGLWNGVTGLVDVIFNPGLAIQSLSAAAKWCDELFTGSIISLFQSDRALIPFMEIRYPEVMIQDALETVKIVFERSSARERGRFVGEGVCFFCGPKIVCAQGARLMSRSATAIKSLDVGSRVWRFVSMQEKLALLTEVGPLEVFAAETANFMAETQRTAESAGRLIKSYIQNIPSKLLDPLISAQKMEKRALNFMQMFVSLEQAELALLELKEIGAAFNNRVKCPSISDQIFKFDLDHLFGLDIVWQSENVVKRLSGFHFDPGGLIEKAGKVIFSKMENGPLGLYKAFVSYGGKAKESSFFPKTWDRLKVMEKIEESLGRVLKIEHYEKKRKLVIFGVTSEGVVIQTIITGFKEGGNGLLQVSSSYPNIKETYRYLSGLK